MSAGGGKNVPHSITLNNKKNITSELSSCAKFVGPGPVPARMLVEQEKAKEEKVSASPSTLKSNSESPKKVRDVERAVAKCSDIGSRSRFSELWDFANRADCAGKVWLEALDAVKVARASSTGTVGGLTATFCAAVVSSINAAGGDIAVAAGATAPRTWRYPAGVGDYAANKDTKILEV